MGGFILVLLEHLAKYARIGILSKGLIGGAAITTIELLVGVFFKYVVDDVLWCYGGITFLGVISLKWSLFWCLLSLCVVWIIENRIARK